MYREDRQIAALGLRRMVGVMFVALGLVGLLLPVVPGIPLLLVAWLLLSRTAHPPSRVPEWRAPGLLPRMQLQFWLLCRRLLRRLDGTTKGARTR